MLAGEPDGRLPEGFQSVLELRDPSNGSAIPPSPQLPDQHQVTIGDENADDLTSRLLSSEPVERLSDEDGVDGFVAEWDVLGDAAASIDRWEPVPERVQHGLRGFDREDVAHERDEFPRQRSRRGAKVERGAVSTEA